MAISYFSNLMESVDGLQKYADPRTKDWFMLFGNPVPVWIITVLYLVFVLYAGPQFMHNRKPYNLKYFMVVYNIGLVIMSMYMFIEIILSTTAARYQWLCSPYNENTWKNHRELRVANVLWLYGISKLIELMDTVLMILRKKQSQVTFLHVFHHATMLNIWWWVPTFIPGGQTWLGACINCLVHVAMYSYYGLAVIPSLREKLWWKKYITTFQLVQFAIAFLHSLQTYTSGCDFPFWGQMLLINYMIIMMILFGNFYIQSYIKNKSSRAKKTDAENDYCIAKNHVEQNGTDIVARNHIKRKQHSNGVTHARNT